MNKKENRDFENIFKRVAEDELKNLPRFDDLSQSAPDGKSNHIVYRYLLFIIIALMLGALGYYLLFSNKPINSNSEDILEYAISDWIAPTDILLSTPFVMTEDLTEELPTDFLNNWSNFENIIENKRNRDE